MFIYNLKVNGGAALKIIIVILSIFMLGVFGFSVYKIFFTSGKFIVNDKMKKQDITEMYKKIRAIENNNGLVFTVDIKMFDSIIPDKDGMYHVRVPYTLGYIDVPLNNMFWLKENKTAQIFFENGKDIRYYSKNIAGNTQNARIVKTNDLKNYLEKKRKENKSNIREEVE